MASVITISNESLKDYIARKFNLFAENIEKHNLTEKAIATALTEITKDLQEKLETTRPSPLEKGQALLYASQQLAICSVAEGESYRFYFQTIATLLDEEDIELLINEQGSSTLYELALSAKYRDNNAELLPKYLERLDNKEEIIFQLIVNPVNPQQTNDVITTCIRGQNTTALTKLLPYIETKANKDRCWQQLVNSNQEELIVNALKTDWLSQDDKDEYLLPAVRVGNYIVVKLLLDRGANVNHQNRYGDTALMSAAKWGTEVTQLLIDNGADINHQGQNGRTALMFVAMFGQTETAHLLIDNGANIHAQDHNRDTALIDAAYNGRTAIVQLLLGKGADIRYQNRVRSTALIEAARWGHTATAEYLLNNGADIEHQDQVGNTALIAAAFRGQTETAQLLLNNGAYVDQQNILERTALIEAAFNGRTEVARLLLNNGANVDHQSREGRTALMYAAAMGYIATLKLLLEKRANIHHQSRDGRTALMQASARSQTESMTLLLEHGAHTHIDHQDQVGHTALMLAAIEGHTATLTLLLAKGAQVAISNNLGKTALDLAQGDCLKILQEHMESNSRPRP